MLCLLTSCLHDNVKKVRIVDNQGNPAKINKIVPKFNEEQMKKQQDSLRGNNTSNIKFVNENSEILQQINDPNIISVNNNLPNDEILADRITNFNYVEETKNPATPTNKNPKIGNVYNADKNLVKEVSVKTNGTVVKQSKKLSGKKYFIQIGVFNEKSNAEVAYSKYSKIYNGVIDNYVSRGKNKYKVSLGPYTDKKIADKDLEKVIKMGHYDVYITEKK